MQAGGVGVPSLAIKSPIPESLRLVSQTAAEIKKLTGFCFWPGVQNFLGPNAGIALLGREMVTVPAIIKRVRVILLYRLIGRERVCRLRVTLHARRQFIWGVHPDRRQICCLRGGHATARRTLPALVGLQCFAYFQGKIFLCSSGEVSLGR